MLGCEREWKRMVLHCEPGSPRAGSFFIPGGSREAAAAAVQSVVRCGSSNGPVLTDSMRGGSSTCGERACTRRTSTTWRKAAHSGSLKALSKKRGRKPERNPLDEKVRKLERRNARLENEFRKAHLIIDVQGKVAGLLGISLDDGTNS